MTFSDLAKNFEMLETTSSRLKITEQLSVLFSNSSSSEIAPICYLLQGRVAPLYADVEFGLADKLLIRAISMASNTPEDAIRTAFRIHGDLGSAAEQVIGMRQPASHLTVNDVFTELTALTGMSGSGSQEQKITAFAALLAKLDPLSIRYLIRIPLGKLRLGLSDMTILDGLSWMLCGDKARRSELEDAYNVSPDIGLLASRLKISGMAGIRNASPEIGIPVLPVLCQRLPGADEMIRKMGTVAVEPKYDGTRVQIHFRRDRKAIFVKSFSRNLEETTDMFPELRLIADQLNAETAIFDSEAIGTDPKTGAIVPFQQTMTRKRKHNIDQLFATVPVTFYVFDILLHNGKNMLGEPLSARKKLLGQVVSGSGPLSVAPLIVTAEAEEIRRYHHEQLRQKLEGVIVKKWNAPYVPGRREYTWVKYKEEEGKEGKLTDTIDVVIMGYYYGEGKRSAFGIGAMLAGIREGDRYLSVTKIGTGVTDELWHDLKRRLRHLETKSKPSAFGEVPKSLIPDVWVEPSMVVEIAGDELTTSPLHTAGIAVRFPRLVRIRDDKRADQVTTAEELITLQRAIS